MSKKTNKILLIAIVALLVISMVALVACGGGSDNKDTDKKDETTTPDPTPGGNDDGEEETPGVLNGKTAMANFQKDFAKKKNASVTEKIKVGGLDIKLSTLIELKVDNVDVEMTRTYTNGVLNIKAAIKNLNVSIPRGLDTIMSFVPANMKEKLNIDETTIANLSKVVLEADVDIDDAMVVTVNKFVIKGLNQVVDAGGEQLKVLADGEGNLLGAVYEPGEIKGTTVDPRHEADPSQAGDQDGLFTAMDKCCNNLQGGTAGTTLETFLTENYKMLSLYEFKNVTVVDDKNISYSGATDFSKVYSVAQGVLDEYLTNAVTPALQVKDADGNVTATLSNAEEIINYLFGTTTVSDVISVLVDMGDANMEGAYATDENGKFTLSNMTTTQTIAIHIPANLLEKAVGMIDGIPAALGNMIPKLIKNGINANINVSTEATFNY